ncbi:MAG: hypothetical protein ABFD90_13120 [Phycisphaerales bacterium]
MRTIVCIVFVCSFAIPGVAQERVTTIHVFVALCDNEHQGIVPVPAALGNGEDPANNLYWGAMYGTKTFLKRGKDWVAVTTVKNPSETVLERIVFKHRTHAAYLVAEAYRGAGIKEAVGDFLVAAAGNRRTTIQVDQKSLGIHGAADLVVYVGHNGLMDFDINTPVPEKNAEPRDAIVLACKSKPYFQPRLAQLKSRCVLLTTGFMAPEAYTLEAAVAGWLAEETAEKIRDRAARAYDRYQKCGLKAARRLFYAEDRN